MLAGGLGEQVLEELGVGGAPVGGRMVWGVLRPWLWQRLEAEMWAQLQQALVPFLRRPVVVAPLTLLVLFAAVSVPRA